MQLMGAILPLLENWLRQTVSDEVAKALEADRQKQKPQKLYTRQEVCAMTNISLPTLWTRMKKGEIKPTQIGRRVLFSEDEVKRFIGNN